MDASNTLLYNPLDLFKHVGIFLVDPVCEIPTIIQDLQQDKGILLPCCFIKKEVIPQSGDYYNFSNVHVLDVDIVSISEAWKNSENQCITAVFLKL